MHPEISRRMLASLHYQKQRNDLERLMFNALKAQCWCRGANPSHPALQDKVDAVIGTHMKGDLSCGDADRLVTSVARLSECGSVTM